MSTATPTLTTDELLEFVAFDEPVPPCSFAGCEAPARWAVRCPTCKLDHQVCNAHRKVLDTWLPVILLGFWTCSAPTGSGRCPGVIPYPIPWRPI